MHCYAVSVLYPPLSSTMLLLHQANDIELQQLKENVTLKMERIQLSGIQVHLYTVFSINTIWPYLPQQHRYTFFCQLHDTTHDNLQVHLDWHQQGHQKLNAHLYYLPSLQENTSHKLPHGHLYTSTLSKLTWLAPFPTVMVTSTSSLALIASHVSQKLHSWLTSQWIPLSVPSSIRGCQDLMSLSTSYLTAEPV